MKPLADDPRRLRAILHRLDPPQDQLGVGLADGEGEHVQFQDELRRAIATYYESTQAKRPAALAGAA
ncbi:MAG TPA: hypothetical protein VHY37_06205 [Tepidisphaeraceae bacterium]|nr:hypothetical protein [Tepidisphaeraceae bacterium]